MKQLFLQVYCPSWQVIQHSVWQTHAPELCTHNLYHTNTHCRSKLRGKAAIKPMSKHECTIFISPLLYMQIHNNDCQKEKRLETLLNNHMMVQYLSCTQNILDSFAYLVSLELFSQPHCKQPSVSLHYIRASH